MQRFLGTNLSFIFQLTSFKKAEDRKYLAALFITHRQESNRHPIDYVQIYSYLGDGFRATADIFCCEFTKNAESFGTYDSPALDAFFKRRSKSPALPTNNILTKKLLMKPPKEQLPRFPYGATEPLKCDEKKIEIIEITE